MRFQSVSLPAENTIGSIYYRNFHRLAPFFPGGDPHKEETFLKRKDYLLANATYNNNVKVADILTNYNRTLGAGEASLANAARLGNQTTLAVVTGQQAGLLTGPLLTIYKAMTAILLAGLYQERLGIPVIPIFWIASEDHDFLEINHIHFLGEKKRSKTVYFPDRPNGQPPVQAIPTGKACIHFLRECLRQFQSGPYLKETKKLLQDTLAGTENIADWFGALLLQLFRDEGLVCLNPMLPELRQLLKPIFQQSMEGVAKISALLARNQGELEAHGFSAPVQKRKDHTHLFLLVDGQRLPVFFHGKNFKVGENSWSSLEIPHIINRSVEKLSPDVILRPLTQEVLLPVLAYVAGPGEIDYWAQLSSVFTYFGLSMPPVYPRSSLTLVEPGMGQIFQRHVIHPEGVFAGLELELRQRIQERDEVGLEKLFGHGRQQLEHVFQQLQEGLEEPMGSLLSKAWETSQMRILKEWKGLEVKAWRKHRGRHHDLIDDFQRISRELLPEGKMQETLYNLFSYYPTYGPGLIKGLMQDNLLSESIHQFVFLEG